VLHCNARKLSNSIGQCLLLMPDRLCLQCHNKDAGCKLYSKSGCTMRRAVPCHNLLSDLYSPQESFVVALFSFLAAGYGRVYA
jgi:hypothetical protein